MRMIVCLMLAGCGIGPGDWAVYRLSQSAPELSGDCWYPETGPAPDQAEDVSTTWQASTVAVFRDADGGWYLDDGEIVMAGTGDGAEVTFAYERTDVSFTMPDGTGDKYTAREQLTLVATFQGTAMTGVRTQTVEVTCEGATCNVLPGACTNSAPVIGVQLPEAEASWPPAG